MFAILVTSESLAVYFNGTYLGQYTGWAEILPSVAAAGRASIRVVICDL